MQLHNFFRSSASYRVRIALALKGLSYDYVPVHLGRNEHFAEPFASDANSRLVPALKLDDGRWLDAVDGDHRVPRRNSPRAAFAAARPFARAQVRALAQDIACEIHPLNNLRVLRYLVNDLKLSEDDKTRWYRHWVETGLATVERRLAQTAGRFCWGDEPSLADCLLVPQIFNARRFDAQLDHVPRVMLVFEVLHAARRLCQDPAKPLPRC